LLNVGHVRQRAPGSHVWQDDVYSLAVSLSEPFWTIGQNIAVSAMKWTPQKAIARTLLVRCCQLGQLVAVAAKIRQGNYAVLLIMVPKDQQLRAHLCLNSLNAFS